MAILLTNAINTNYVALKLIKDYLTQPSLAGITIMTEKYEEDKDAEVSQQILINSSGSKTIVNDNIAPKQRVWNVEGFIQGEPYEFSTFYMPSLARKKNLLDTAFYSRQPVQFKDKENKYHQVGIEKLTFTKEVDNQNTQPIRFSLREITELSSISGISDAVQQNASPIKGSKDSDTSNLGHSTSTKYDSIAWRAGSQISKLF